MRIAVDALGGDNAPGEILAGTAAAARALPGVEFVLVGERLEVPAVPENVSFRESGPAVGMDEEPASALRARPDASVAVAAAMVREGAADALFSAGSTGATVAAALLRVGRLEGCRRPAIATVLPFRHPVLLLDAGATLACRPHDLLVFAILGGVFARRYFDLDEGARVGLLNVGEEPGKGNDLVREAYRILSFPEGLRAAGRFVGNVEGRDLGAGVVDVVVTDGFTGNVVLKTAEGVAREVLGLIREAVSEGLASRLAAGALRPRLYGVRDRLDPEAYGGSFLLGVRSSVVIGHGNSTARGVENALRGISRAGAGLTGDLAAALQALRERSAGGES